MEPVTGERSLSSSLELNNLWNSAIQKFQLLDWESFESAGHQAGFLCTQRKVELEKIVRRIQAIVEEYPLISMTLYEWNSPFGFSFYFGEVGTAKENEIVAIPLLEGHLIVWLLAQKESSNRWLWKSPKGTIFRTEVTLKRLYTGRARPLSTKGFLRKTVSLARNFSEGQRERHILRALHPYDSMMKSGGCSKKLYLEIHLILQDKSLDSQHVWNQRWDEEDTSSSIDESSEEVDLEWSSLDPTEESKIIDQPLVEEDVVKTTVSEVSFSEDSEVDLIRSELSPGHFHSMPMFPEVKFPGTLLEDSRAKRALTSTVPVAQERVQRANSSHWQRLGHIVKGLKRVF